MAERFGELLEGLDGEEREARLALLTELEAAGVPYDRLREACAEDRLAFLPVEHALAGQGVYTEGELFERAGVDADFVRRHWLALGFPLADPDARQFTDADVEAAERAALFRRAGLPEEGMLEVARVMGEATARIADAVRMLVGETFLGEGGETERDVGLRYVEVARQLTPQLGPMLEHILQAHLIQQIRSDVVSRTELLAGRATPGSRMVTVAFADLVGFTRLGTEVDTAELGAVAGRLATLATDVAKSPVRLVKSLGDAVMLVSADADALLDAVLRLVDAAEAEDGLPELRAGVATGLALSRGGDWYGHTVNLASRLTGLARPCSVLATREVRDAAQRERQWSFAGERRVKGVREPVRLYRVR